MRLAHKTVIKRPVIEGTSNPSDFVLQEFEFAIRDKGYNVIHEKSYMCSCKAKESAARNSCKNCGGTGWIFANPTKTKMIISGIKYERRFEDVGTQDMGMVSVSAMSMDKLGYMDRIVVLDATAEYTQILYPTKTDDGTRYFAFTKYDIQSFDFMGLFVTIDQKLQRLVEPTDYSFHDNVIEFVAGHNTWVEPCITVRYIHNPTYHIVDISRESMTSTKFTQNQGQQKLIMPVHAIAQRAHLIKDVENFDGSRLLDNSWLPQIMTDPDVSAFYRQLQYTTAQDIYDHITATQKTELLALLP